MASVLGKRKERGESEEHPTHGTTLFVSNLPYTATTTDLQTLFSEVGPVRSAFVVLEQGSGVSKGVGYVSFAIAEDANTAIDRVTSGGVVLDGRTLRAQWAEKKPKDTKVAKKEPSARPPQPRPAKPALDPLAIRTVVISGLPSSIDSKILWKKMRKLNGADSVQWPIKSEDGEEDASTAHVLFTRPSHAAEAVTKLHAHVFKGSLLSVTLKRRLERLVKPKKAAAAAASPSRASRLIVRNLPWDITEQDLRALFLPYGPIHSIHIPSSQGDKAKGFAFVWMLSNSDAEKAIAGCNGKSVRAGLAEGLLEDKQKRKKQKREEMKRQSGSEVVVDAEEGAEDKTFGNARVITVDWALSKGKWMEEKAKMPIVDEKNVVDDAGSGSDDSGSELEEDGGSSGVRESLEDSNENSGDSDDDTLDTHKTVEKPQLPPPEAGTTLFVRNIPFEATNDELRILFRAFGPLRYARVTVDPASGRSRGTGFVCFWNKADADKVIEQSELLRAETTGDHPTKKNPFTVSSILTPDPSSTLAQTLVLQGRTLDVVCALSREEADKLKEEGEKKREKADKRNMYLLREGVVFPNSPAAEGLSTAELERRTSSFNARRALMRNNPALFVSKTRLSVRQIPLFVTERVLKRLAVHAVRTFDSEVKKGSRAALTEEELLEPAVEEQEEDQEDINEKKKTKGAKKLGGRNTGVKQAKIVRQQERVDAVTGKGRSKGYGFVEMFTHADALRVLRWANNNIDLFPLLEEWWKDELKDLIKLEKEKPEKERDDARMKRISGELERHGNGKGKATLMVEFSIENIQVVRRRSNRQQEHSTVPENGRQRELVAREVEPEEPTPPTKRRHTSQVAKAPEIVNDVPMTQGPRIGFLIGRKRRQRKGGK